MREDRHALGEQKVKDGKLRSLAIPSISLPILISRSYLKRDQRGDDKLKIFTPKKLAVETEFHGMCDVTI
jgi:hypothetical protein